MPIMVHDILEQGLRGIPGISRMGDLLSRYAYDQDAQDVIRRYRNLSAWLIGCPVRRLYKIEPNKDNQQIPRKLT